MGAGKNDDLCNYPRRLEKNKQALAKMENGQVALAFLDHLFILGLSLARVSKYSAHLRTIQRLIQSFLDVLILKVLARARAIIRTDILSSYISTRNSMYW